MSSRRGGAPAEARSSRRGGRRVEQLARVHDVAYIDAIARTAGQAVALDPDTYTSPETFEVAMLAAGAAVDAVERVMCGRHTRALALVRPPGHHAERGHAMGFCFFNNVAVAAAHARTLGASRVAILDYDVHHGNGTQHTFESDPDILYMSTHQFPFYPGTGAVDEVGVGKAAGRTVNIPLEGGATDDDYRVVFDEVVVPVLKQFCPDVLLVSAGFDAHEHDPLASMRLTTGAFAAMTTELRRVAEQCCGGRLMLVTEGGYDLRALFDSLQACVHALHAPSLDPEWPTSAVRSSRGREAADAAKRVQRRYWELPD